MGLVTRRSEQLDKLFDQFAVDPKKPKAKTDKKKEQAESNKNKEEKN
ncbi:SPJ_0845 family protein [Limosilactobacillus walteri]|nr:SPJ_0845 family protein [Limosilactobacillus walteri]